MDENNLDQDDKHVIASVLKKFQSAAEREYTNDTPCGYVTFDTLHPLPLARLSYLEKILAQKGFCRFERSKRYSGILRVSYLCTQKELKETLEKLS